MEIGDGEHLLMLFSWCRCYCLQIPTIRCFLAVFRGLGLWERSVTHMPFLHFQKFGLTLSQIHSLQSPPWKDHLKSANHVEYPMQIGEIRKEYQQYQHTSFYSREIKNGCIAEAVHTITHIRYWINTNICPIICLTALCTLLSATTFESLLRETIQYNIHSFNLHGVERYPSLDFHLHGFALKGDLFYSTASAMDSWLFIEDTGRGFLVLEIFYPITPPRILQSKKLRWERERERGCWKIMKQRKSQESTLLTRVENNKTNKVQASRFCSPAFHTWDPKTATPKWKRRYSKWWYWKWRWRLW